MADYTKELSKNSKKAYKWLCDFIGEKLKISDHAWYGPTIWLDIDKLGITDDMLETINDEFYKHMNDWGVNQISAESGIWGRGNTYLITFEPQKEERVDDSTKMGLIKEVEKYCDKQRIKVSIDEFDFNDEHFTEIVIDDFIYEELSDIAKIIRKYAIVKDEDSLAGNGYYWRTVSK